MHRVSRAVVWLWALVLSWGLAGCAASASAPGSEASAAAKQDAARGKAAGAGDTETARSPEPSPAPPADKPAEPQAAPEPEPPAIVIRQMEIYGRITARAGTALHVLSLVMTREEPPPPGSEGTLFRKIEVPGQASEWIPIARVTLKQFATGGKLELVIVEELPEQADSSGSVKPGKSKINAFARGTSVKAQMTL